MIGKPIDQSIKLVNWYRLAQQPQTDVTRATCPIICHFEEALRTKLIKQFRPSLPNAKNIPVLRVLELLSCPSLPFCVIMPTQHVREEGLLNILSIVKGYNPRQNCWHAPPY